MKMVEIPGYGIFLSLPPIAINFFRVFLFLNIPIPGIRPSRSSRDSDIVSSQTERRGEIYNDEFNIPGKK